MRCYEIRAKDRRLGVYLDESLFPHGGGGPVCRACKEPIEDGERSTRIAFSHDADGRNGLTGEYHARCSRPFDSLARAMNMLSHFGH